LSTERVGSPAVRSLVDGMLSLGRAGNRRAGLS